MSVATRIIKKFGGPYKLAALLDCRPSTIYRWTYSTDDGGTGGLIPSKHHKTLLDLAPAQGVKLRLADLHPKMRDLAA